MDEKSLSHTSWNCKYHIVLVPKYRRKCNARPHSYARIDSAEIGGSRFYGILERQEYVDDF